MSMMSRHILTYKNSYSTLSYLMWDITNILHIKITSLLYPRLQDQINKHLSQDQVSNEITRSNKLRIDYDIIYNNSYLIL